MQYNLKNIYAWPQKTRILIFILTGFVAVYLGYLWDISDVEKRLSNEQQQELNLKKQLEILFLKQEYVRSDTAQLLHSNSMLHEWQKKLITSDQLPELLNEILKIGATNQLHFTLFSPGSEKKEGDYLRVPIKIIAVGNYHQLADFISQVANMAWIVVIDDFSFSKGITKTALENNSEAQKDTGDLLTAEIALEVYYRDDKKNQNH